MAFEMREGLYCIANQSLLSTRVFSQVSFLCDSQAHPSHLKPTWINSGEFDLTLCSANLIIVVCVCVREETRWECEATGETLSQVRICPSALKRTTKNS